MSEPQKYTILASLTKGCPWIKFDADKCQFECTCGERLQLNKIVVDRFYKENAIPLIQSIVDRDVNPWLEEHHDCCGSALAE